MRKPLAAFVLSLLVTGLAAGQATKAAAAKAATKAEPKFKAIWEPVPYTKDVNLNAVACVAAETCWVAGDKGTILHTTDGGKTWQVQLGGDPESTDDDFSTIVFLDDKHGWAMSEIGKILGTRDGSTWVELSTVSSTTKGLWFVSPETGFRNEYPQNQTMLHRSDDGGKTWTPVTACSLDAIVDGLPRKLACMMDATQFISPAVGYLGGGVGQEAPAAFGKTSDGGQSWAISLLPETKFSITNLNFWTEKDGIAVLSKGEAVYWTADGGGTWTRSVMQRLWPSYYGVGEGKIIVGVKDGDGIVYSFNGGRNFTSRAFSLPARVTDVTFPDARHGYLVGEHGMVYRYRIVPIDYKSQGMIGALAP